MEIVNATVQKRSRNRTQTGERVQTEQKMNATIKKRCPIGTYRETGESVQPGQNSIQIVNATTKKRCPTGTQRDKKTGECVQTGPKTIRNVSKPPTMYANVNSNVFNQSQVKNATGEDIQILLGKSNKANNGAYNKRRELLVVELFNMKSDDVRLENAVWK